MKCVYYLFLYLIFLSSPVYTEVQFVDVTSSAGIDFQHVDGRSGEKYLIETLGSGALFFDYNVDGNIDLYIVNATHILPPNQATESASNHTQLPKNALYQNNGDGTFTDVTQKADVGDIGYGVGCAAADIDNDGYPEIYVTNFGINRLYYNNGDGTFTDITEKAGVGDKRWGTGCAFLDYNMDGYVDLYVVNYMIYFTSNDRGWESRGVRIYCSPVDQIDKSIFKSEPDILYRNNGDGTFTDVTKVAGISHRGLGLAVAVGDYDNDGDPDLHIANDMEPDLLYQNNGDGTFTDVTDLTGTGYDENGIPGSGMGSAFGDYDNDGFLDLVVSNAPSQPMLLFHNEKAQYFTDVSYAARIGAVTVPYFKWAVEFFDYNNDGLQDIFVSNGHLQDNINLFSDATYAQTDLLFENNHRDGTHVFSNVSVEVGLTQLPKKVGRGAAFGDYDNDGDTDILITTCGGKPVLLRNDSKTGNRWLKIKLIGTKSNRDGIGAKVYVKTDRTTQVREATSGGSYASGSDHTLLFGLGTQAKVQSVEVKWQGGHIQKLVNIDANQVIRLKENR
jgi:hypothetical protein